MSQHDFNISNQGSGPSRADLNNALKALASLSSGASAPVTTYANMPWVDTATNILKIRSEADDAWINICYLDQGLDTFNLLDDTLVTDTSGNQTGLIGDQTTAAWEAGTSTTESLVSPEKIAAAILALSPSIGDGQTWQDVKGSRSYGVAYQNTTGRSIMVAARGPDDESFEVSITGGSPWVELGRSDTDQDSGGQPGGFIIPDTYYYRWTGSGPAGTRTWSELR